MNEVLAILNTLILAATAWIVWLYTKATKQTNELQVQPVLNLSIAEFDNGANKIFKLIVKNVGRATAYNIIFSPLTAGEYTYYPIFEDKDSPILETSISKRIHFWVKKEPNITEAYDNTLGFRFFLNRFFPNNVRLEDHEKFKRTAAIFVINYEGVNGNQYHSVFRIYSKIWPLLAVYDLVSEFIRIDGGKCSVKEAERLCAEKELLSKFPNE